MLFSRFDSHGTNNAMIAIVFCALLFIWLSWFLCADKIIAPESGIVALALRSAKAKATGAQAIRPEKDRALSFDLFGQRRDRRHLPKTAGSHSLFHHCFHEVEEIKAAGQTRGYLLSH